MRWKLTLIVILVIFLYFVGFPIIAAWYLDNFGKEE